MVDVSIKTKIIFEFVAGQVFTMEGIGESNYMVFVPPRWNTRDCESTFMWISRVWDIQSIVAWGDWMGNNWEMVGTFGELWKSKEWKKGSDASFWLDDCNGGWAFFTKMDDNNLPMGEGEFYLWLILGHALRVSKWMEGQQGTTRLSQSKREKMWNP